MNGRRIQTWPRRSSDAGGWEKLLLHSTGAALAGNTTATFKVTTPDVKCEVKITVFIRLPNGSALRYLTDDSTGPTAVAGSYAGGVRLWMPSLTRVQGSSQMPPTREIVPQRGNGLLLPASPDLWGFEMVSQVVGDVIYGELTCKSTEGDVVNAPAADVDWYVRADFQSTVEMSDEDWAHFTGRAAIEAQARTLA
jgi:hypothetical protein